MNKKHLLVLSAPSGGGKSTIAKKLLSEFSNLKLSVSATTRAMRPGEENGVQYYFMTKEEFKLGIQNHDFVEYEEIFDNFYGTPKREIEESVKTGNCILFDIDVKGAMSIKRAFPDDSLLIFITPPDLQTLESRLRNRMTESEDQIKTRLNRAAMEMSEMDKFDKIVVNDILEEAISETMEIVKTNLAVE